MREKLKIASQNTDAVLDIPEEKSKKAILFIPGVSGKALGDEYNELAEIFIKKDYAFLRFQSWEDGGKGINKKTINSIHKELDLVIKYLKSLGVNNIYVIAKSFGGGMILTYKNPLIKKMVLWAPAIDIDKKENISGIQNKSLGEIKKCLDIKLDKNYLKDLNIPIRIIQGDKDKVVSIENSKKIINALNDAELIVIKRLAHSYENKDQKNDLYKKTMKLINSE